MKSLKQTYRIHASIEDVWNALTNSKAIDGWGAGPAKMNDKKRKKFSLWGGSIWGTNIEVVKQKKLVQEWYSKEKNKWEQPSHVTFTLTKEKDSVRVDLHHTDIPDADAKNIDIGWKDYYLGPLKEFVEKKI